MVLHHNYFFLVLSAINKKIFFMKKLVYLLIALPYFAMAHNINKTTVSHLDTKKYMGLWYEIARYDTWFQKGLSNCTAYYTLKDNGKIEVLNTGYKDNGQIKTAKGKAKLTKEEGKLKVSFFLFFYGDYWILDIEPLEYSWVVVGSKSDKYLWIMARKPYLEPQILKEIMHNLEQRGYNTNNLLFSNSPAF